MSSREMKRLGVLARVEKEALNLVYAAEIPGLSYRQTKRRGGDIGKRVPRGCSIVVWDGSRAETSRRSFAGKYGGWYDGNTREK
jgi:hypothetical protein